MCTFCTGARHSQIDAFLETAILAAIARLHGDLAVAAVVALLATRLADVLKRATKKTLKVTTNLKHTLISSHPTVPAQVEQIITLYDLGFDASTKKLVSIHCDLEDVTT